MLYPKINLHIHSTYSDGKNDVKKIVNVALDSNFACIAITDHFTDTAKANLIPTLDSSEKISEYINEITEYKAYLGKSNKKLLLLKGIEIDLESSEPYIKKYIQIDDFDLLLFEHLESLEGIAYLKKLINLWRQIIKNKKKCPIMGLAHFDPSYFIYGGLDVLIKFLKDYEIYFEFNASYPEFYSSKYELFFKKLREKQILVAIGSDAHDSHDIDNIEEPLSMIAFYNLDSNFEQFIGRLKRYKS